MSSILVEPSVEDSVNARFSSVDQGFINAHNEPAMTTPSAIVTQTLVVGSTICLIC
ncbi:hypothetical protein J2T10_002775 [Paenarthrobacter nicotinovorans]|jgi:hypothetical protein|uniref:Uncharacterized protein n=1 Tax=Paenarthrobacter nicotinovorans TaxID=29320 RepID=A0ABT9TN66_PAENI|nr:cypemycin family RiPP [Paenarthrobacter nicotinovorans]MDQ0103118.1 hypothetical protein [Paenarthrobacter nicotinovorans]